MLLLANLRERSSLSKVLLISFANSVSRRDGLASGSYHRSEHERGIKSTSSPHPTRTAPSSRCRCHRHLCSSASFTFSSLVPEEHLLLFLTLRHHAGGTPRCLCSLRQHTQSAAHGCIAVFALTRPKRRSTRQLPDIGKAELGLALPSQLPSSLLVLDTIRER